MAIKKPAPNTGDSKPRHRSPNYPAVGLRDAVARLEKFYKADGKAGAPAELAAVHIGFAKPHGQAMSVLAALKKFGLVSDLKGRWVPTQRAIEILNLPESDARREAALQAAVLSPEIYRELITAHQQTGWPKNDVLESELVTYRNFNPNSVKGFVDDLKDSLEFAGLSDLSALDLEGEEDPNVVETPETPLVAPLYPPPAKAAKQMGARSLAAQVLAISIPRNFTVDIAIKGDELKKEDIPKIKSQFNRWIEGLEEAFEE